MKTAVIGLGFMGKTYLKLLGEMQLYTVGIDNDARQREIAEDFFDIDTYEDLNEYQGKLDMIFICTPSYRHKEDAITAVYRSPRVVIEKPVALNVEDASAIAFSAKERSSLVLTAFVERYNNPFVLLKTHIKKWTKSTRLEIVREAQTPTHATWYRDDQLSGGPLVDLGIHDFDMIPQLIGPVHDMEAVMIDDRYLVLLSCERGDASLVCGWSDDRHTTLRCVGGNGEIFFSEDFSAQRYPDAYRAMLDSFIHGDGNQSDIQAGIASLILAEKAKHLIKEDDESTAAERLV